MRIRFIITVVAALVTANPAVAGHKDEENLEPVDPESKAAILGRNYYREAESEIARLVINARMEFISHICHLSGQEQENSAMRRINGALKKLRDDAQWLITFFGKGNLSSKDYLYFRGIVSIIEESFSYGANQSPAGKRETIASTYSYHYALERYHGRKEEYSNTADWLLKVASPPDWMVTVLNAYECIGTLGD